MFYVCCDDIRDLEFSEAFKRLMTLFVNGLKEGTITMTENIRIELLDWYTSQPAFIQTFCYDLLDNLSMGSVNGGLGMSIPA